MEREQVRVKNPELANFINPKLACNALKNILHQQYFDAKAVVEGRVDRLTNEAVQTRSGTFAIIAKKVSSATCVLANLKKASEVTRAIEDSFEPHLAAQIRHTVVRQFFLTEEESLIFLKGYTARFGQVSLSEIENLPLPFTFREFVAISDFIREANGDPRTIDSEFFRRISIGLMFAADNPNPPEKISPLIKRLRAYFDFFKKVIIDHQVDEVEEQLFLDYFKQWPKDNGTIFAAVLADLRVAGLIPLSFSNILHVRRGQSIDPAGWDNLIQFFLAGQSEFDRTTSLRKNPRFKKRFEEIFWSSERDQKLAQFLLSFFGDNQITPAEFAQLIIDNRCTIEKIGSHGIRIQNLTTPVSPHRFKPGGNHLSICEVELEIGGGANSIIYLKFSNSEDNLLVQLTPQGEFFGLPVVLETDYPAYSEAIKNTILKIYLEFLDSKQREAEDQQRERQERASLRRMRKIRQETGKEILPKISTHLDYSPAKPQRLNLTSTKKRKSQQTPQLSDYQERESRIIESSTLKQEKNLRRVFYSKDLVVKLLGGRADEQIFRRILRGLISFEAGLGDVKKMEPARYGTRVIEEDIWRLRIGKFRVLLKKDNGVFLPISVGRRHSGARYQVA